MSSFIGGGNALDREDLVKLGFNEREINKFFVELENLNVLEFDEINNVYKIIVFICEMM